MCVYSAWLMDNVDPLIARVSRRAQALANLTLESAEDLQVSSHSEPALCRYNWHSAGSLSWPFPTLKY